jgi:hypothetical protein
VFLWAIRGRRPARMGNIYQIKAKAVPLHTMEALGGEEI